MNMPERNSQSDQKKSIRSRISGWLISPNFATDETTRRQVELLSSLLLAITILVSIRMMVSIMGDGVTLQNQTFVISLMAVTTLVIAYFIARTKAYSWAVALTAAVLTGFILFSVVEKNPSNSDQVTASLIWLLLPILVGSVFYSVRGTLILAGLVALSSVLLSLVVPQLETSYLYGALAFLFVTVSALTVVDVHRARLEGFRRAELAERNEELQDIQANLEDMVLARTERFETMAVLNEHFSGILDFDRLLIELVNQVKEQFNYYHAHVYLFDDDRQNLVMTVGVGQAGAEMKASGHQIPIDARTSLVARAARTSQIVREDNVREAADWLPNALLPDTYSEMAVPILLEEQVLGVLDVQEDEVAGLDDSDAGILRLLANQISVAIRNARAFEQVDVARQEAEALQARYIHQAWNQSGMDYQEYHYHRADAPLLDEAAKAKLQEEAVRRSALAVITADASSSDEAETETADMPSALVAPIKVQDEIIGVMEFVDGDAAQSRQWSPEEIALVQFVTEQVAQTAENLRLFDEAQTRANYERTVSDVTQKLRQAPNLEALSQTTAEALATVLGVSGGGIRLYRQKATSEENGN